MEEVTFWTPDGWSLRRCMGRAFSRLVAKEIKIHNAPDLFAASRPIERLKYRLGAAHVHGHHACGCRAGGRAATPRRSDKFRGFYTKLPVEDQHEGEDEAHECHVRCQRDAARQSQNTCGRGSSSWARCHHASSATTNCKACGPARGSDFVFVGESGRARASSVRLPTR